MQNLTTLSAKQFIEKLEAYRSPTEAAKSLRYFKTGEGEYGEGDVFMGVRMGKIFALAKESVGLPINEIEKLLNSPIHEARAGAVPNPVDLNFGDALRLQGYALPTRTLQPGSPFDLTLHWRAPAPPARPLPLRLSLRVSVHIVSADGSTWADSTFPVQPEAQTVQPVLAADTPPGVYDLVIGLYTEGPNGPERLKLLAADGRDIGDEVRLTGVRVPDP